MAQTSDTRGRLRILVTRTDRIGDVIVSTPVFQSIKARYPGCFLAYMVFKETAPLLKNHPFIDEIIVYDKKGVHHSWLSSFFFALWLRRWRFDVVVHLHPTNRMYVTSWIAGIPKRVGWKRKWHRLMTETVPETKWQGLRHEAEYNFDLLERIDVQKPPRLTQYVYGGKKKGADHLVIRYPGLQKKPFFVIHPSASCPSKIWHAERYAQLIERIFAAYGMTAVLMGEGPGIRYAAQVEKSAAAAVVNLAGALDLEQVTELLASAVFLVSNDSGPVHIASALEVPVLSIFGRNQAGLSATRWRPLSPSSRFIQKDTGCVFCLADRCQIGLRCLTELSVEEVFREVEQFEPVFASRMKTKPASALS